MIKQEDLEIAFGKILGKSGYSEGQVRELAEFIISLFGFDYAVVDNRLTPQERDVFYRLEEHNLVYTKQEEVTVRKGKVWRLHYWFLNRQLILRLARGEEEPEVPEEFDVYEHMDDDVWKRHLVGEGDPDE